ncbi:MAG TPA: shikimate kinase [Galbitalea sp.]
MTVILIGPPGGGKTRLGKRVAKSLGIPFVDTDKLVVAKHGAIAKIFQVHGESHFRALEREAVVEALAQDAVVSLGGGAILDADTQTDLEGRRVALITVSADAVASRITGDKRPLVTSVESWTVLVEARRATYERLAGRTWDTSFRPLAPIAHEIAAWAASEPKEEPS